MKKLVCRFLCLGIVLAVSMNLVGCSDDDGPVGTLYFPRDVCMVDKPGGTASVEFTAVNIVKLNITDTPEGWTVTADLQTSRMTASMLRLSVSRMRESPPSPTGLSGRTV